MMTFFSKIFLFFCHKKKIKHKTSKISDTLQIKGSGGLDCEFWVVEHGRYGGADEVYSFESTKYPGSFMAFQKNGKPGHLISPDLPISTQFRLRIAAS